MTLLSISGLYHKNIVLGLLTFDFNFGTPQSSEEKEQFRSPKLWFIKNKKNILQILQN